MSLNFVYISRVLRRHRSRIQGSRFSLRENYEYRNAAKVQGMETEQRLSAMRTVCPLDSKRLTRRVPTKPEPPIIVIIIE